jgi:hypothetical protein
MKTQYRHTQVGWVMLAALVGAAVVILVLLPSAHAPLPVSIVMAVVLLILLLFSFLTVEVDSDEVRVSYTAGLLRKRIALADVASFRPVRNAWWYGFGIRLLPGGGWLWNVSGLDAVELSLRDGGRFRVGTDEPDALARAIGAATGQPPTPTGGAAGAGGSGGWGSRTAVIIAAVAVAALVLVLALTVAQMRPLKVTVTPDHIQVHTLFYGQEYRFDDVTEVTLERCLPRVLQRTNGFAAHGVLRGWFRLQDLGEGKLFVDYGNAPFVLVRLRRGFVILNLADAQKTQALYDEIQMRRGARAAMP